MRFFFIQDTNKGVVSGQEPLSLKLSMAGFIVYETVLAFQRKANSSGCLAFVILFLAFGSKWSLLHHPQIRMLLHRVLR